MAHNSSSVLRSKAHLIDSYLSSDSAITHNSQILCSPNRSLQQHEPQKRIGQDSLSPKLQRLLQESSPRQIEFHRPKWQKYINENSKNNRASPSSTEIQTNERRKHNLGSSSEKQKLTHLSLHESQYDSFGQERSFQIENESAQNFSQNSEKKLQFFQLDLNDMKQEIKEDNQQDTSRFQIEDDIINQNEQTRRQRCQDFVKIIDEEALNREKGNDPRQYEQTHQVVLTEDQHGFQNKLMQMNSYIKQS